LQAFHNKQSPENSPASHINPVSSFYKLGRRCIGGVNILNPFTPLLEPVLLAQFLPVFFLVASVVQRLELIEARHGIDR